MSFLEVWHEIKKMTSFLFPAMFLLLVSAKPSRSIVLFWQARRPCRPRRNPGRNRRRSDASRLPDAFPYLDEPSPSELGDAGRLATASCCSTQCRPNGLEPHKGFIHCVLEAAVLTRTGGRLLPHAALMVPELGAASRTKPGILTLQLLLLPMVCGDGRWRVAQPNRW